MKNSNLHKAKAAKNDEFYTQLSDIENELRHYRKHFKDKTVFLNCDDPTESNFWKFFSMQFNVLGLKKLIATHYDELGTSYSLSISSYGQKITRKELNGNGDFRSPEAIVLLKQADIVVTNPPFSLFKEYMAQLMEYDKKFLIVGNLNAVTYQEIFPYLKDEKIWVGVSPRSMDFVLPKEALNFSKIVDGVKLKTVNSVWFTNLDHEKRHEPMTLARHYDIEKYPKYDNYDAIEVSKMVNIPINYNGYMGIPITGLDKLNPDEFEIVGLMATTKITDTNFGYPFVNGKKKYARIIIKRRAK